jgi:hypothetical protein
LACCQKQTTEIHLSLHPTTKHEAHKKDEIKTVDETKIWENESPPFLLDKPERKGLRPLHYKQDEMNKLEQNKHLL